MSWLTRRPDFLWVYSKVPKNSAGVLPCFFVNSSARSGRMRRIEVFMAWSQEPVSMPHQLDLALEHPMQRVEIGAGVIAEIFHQILLRLAFVVAMPAGVHDEDVALADVGAAALDHLGRDHRPVVHVLGDVDHHAAVDEIIER